MTKIMVHAMDKMKNSKKLYIMTKMAGQGNFSKQFLSEKWKNWMKYNKNAAV